MKAKDDSLTQEYDKISAELEKARKTVGNLEQLEREYDRLHKKWVSALNLLPEEEEIARLLRRITKSGNQSGLSFELFEPGNVVKKEFFAENPIKVRVKGKYHQLGIFLSKVSNLDRIVNVSGLEINPIDKNLSDPVGRSDTIEAEMTLTAYTLIEGGEVNVENNEKTKS
jgi:type IV pilus assembly protein PilO